MSQVSKTATGQSEPVASAWASRHLGDTPHVWTRTPRGTLPRHQEGDLGGARISGRSLNAWGLQFSVSKMQQHE